jgi:transformation/transcription domain-associated protein
MLTLLPREQHIEFIQQQEKFLAEMISLQVNDMLLPLRELFHADSDLAYQLWLQLMPILWSILTAEQQKKLEQLLVNFLAHEYHNKQQKNQPNVIQARN